MKGFGLRLRDRPEILWSPIVLVALLAVWWAVTAARVVSPFVLPAPGAVAEALGLLIGSDWFYEHLWVTSLEAGLGFVIGSALSFVLGLIVATSQPLRVMLQPYIVAFQVTPKIALAPVFVIWLGFGMESKVAVSISLSFFPVFIGTVAGFHNVSPNALWLMQSLRASQGQVLTMLRLRAAMPFIFAGLKTSVTLALIGAVVAESVTARAGLGTLLDEFSASVQMALLWATAAIIGLLGLVFYGTVALFNRRIVWWEP